MAIRTSAPRPAKASPGAPKKVKSQVTIVAWEDIDTWPSRTQGSVELFGDFIMKPSAKMHSFYTTASTQDGSWESDGEEDALVLNHKFVAEHPGDDVASENFVQQWFGVPAIVIVDYCDGTPKKVYGTECAPLSLKPSVTANNEKTAFILDFEAFAATNLLPGRYSGNMDFAGDLAFTALDNTQVKFDGVGRHATLAEGSGASTKITDVSGLEYGDTVVLIGSGGSSPDTLASATNASDIGYILTGLWTALEGAKLHLKFYDDGSNDPMFVEVARS